MLVRIILPRSERAEISVKRAVAPKQTLAMGSESSRDISRRVALTGCLTRDRIFPVRPVVLQTKLNQMRRKLRFAVIISRQILTIVEALAFPPEQRRTTSPSVRRMSLVSRFLAVFGGVIRMRRAWQDFKKSEPRRKRKRVAKSPKQRQRPNGSPHPRTRPETS